MARRTMEFFVGLVLFSVSVSVSGIPNRRIDYTPLLNELRMPCLAENIKDTDHYICTDDHKMICHTGWTNTDNFCRDPICSFIDGSGSNKPRSCKNGDCVRPNVCSCEVGWEGVACDQCVKMPGCQNGHCHNEAFQCLCDEGWTGPLCNEPICAAGCDKGYCKSPGECICDEGYKGNNCDVCIELPGCVHGACNDKPLTCNCFEGYMGALCSCPKCKSGCNLEHGFCENEGECLCHPGWEGENCDKCTPYPGCPAGGICVNPWDCICEHGVTGDNCGKNLPEVHQILHEYYHHEMEDTCLQMNREVQPETTTRGRASELDDPLDEHVY